MTRVSFRDLQLFVVLRATRAGATSPARPLRLQKPVIAAAAVLGGLRGYRPRYD